MVGNDLIEWGIFTGYDLNCAGEYVTYNGKTLTQGVIHHNDVLVFRKRSIMVEQNDHFTKYVTLDKNKN